MKIISMHILLQGESKAIFLKSSFKLDYIPYLKRFMADQPLLFGARTCVSKMKKKETIKLEMKDIENAVLYAHVNAEGLASVIITDKDYPENACKKILIEMLNKFKNLFSHDLLTQYKQDQKMKFKELDDMIRKYQDPKEADKLLKIESELDDLQGMLTKTMEDLLERGENLDEMMKQSEDVSNMAYTFYTSSKKANKKCCSIY